MIFITNLVFLLESYITTNRLSIKMTELAVPHLTTAITGPLRQLEKQVLENQVIIEKWFREAWKKTPTPKAGIAEKHSHLTAL